MTIWPEVEPPDYLPSDILTWASEHRELLELVVEEFLGTGGWPERQKLTRRVAREGRPMALDSIFRGMPKPLGFQQGFPEQIVLLLFGLRLTSSGQKLLGDFMAALERAVDVFSGEDEEPTLHRYEVDQWESHTDPYLDAFSEVLLREAPFLGSKQGGPKDDWNAEVTEDVIRYIHARNIDDYLRIRAEELSSLPQFGFQELSFSTASPSPPVLQEPKPIQDSRDAFISHASEDKDDVARPLAIELEKLGHSVWFDEAELLVGDSLIESINWGLSHSKFGVVVLSPAFFSKPWPQEELKALISLQVAGRNRVLPIWHGIDVDYLAERAPLLASRLAANTEEGIPAVADKVSRAILIRGAESSQAAAAPSLRSDENLSSEIGRKASEGRGTPSGRMLQEQAPQTRGGPEHWMVYDGMLLFRVLACPVQNDLRAPRGKEVRTLLERASGAAERYAEEHWRPAAKGILLRNLMAGWESDAPRHWYAGRSSVDVERLISTPTAAAAFVTRPLVLAIDRTLPTAVPMRDGGVYYAAHEPEIAADVAAACRFVGALFDPIGAREVDIYVQIAAGASTSQLVSAEAYSDTPFGTPHEGIGLRPPFASAHYSDVDRVSIAEMIVAPEAVASRLLDDWLTTFREGDVFEELRQ